MGNPVEKPCPGCALRADKLGTEWQVTHKGVFQRLLPRLVPPPWGRLSTDFPATARRPC